MNNKKFTKIYNKTVAFFVQLFYYIAKMENKVKNVEKCKQRRREKYLAQKQLLIKSAREQIAAAEHSVADKDAYEIIERLAFELAEAETMSVSETEHIIQETYYTIRCELDVLTPFIEDDNVTEIMVNGYRDIYVERGGFIEKADTEFDSVLSLEEVIRRIAGKVHREINERSPILDARLESGERVNAVYKNIALGGPSLSIRKFPKTALEMDDLINMGTITNEAAEYLKKLVHAGYNIFVSGGTSSGKTTFLNILSNYINESQRVVVVEDSAELQLRSIENLVRLECRNANVQGKGEINMDTLIRTSLRMRPDWIIVGEIRGGECSSMLQAMNTGHFGMSTGHANSVEGMLRRMEAMYIQHTLIPIEAVREQIAQGIDVIVHLGRIFGVGRRVMEIAEIQGLNDNKFMINTLFKYEINKGLIKTESELMNKEKLWMAESSR